MLSEVEVGGRRIADNAPETIRITSDYPSVWDSNSCLAPRAAEARGAKAGLFLLVAMLLCLSFVSFYTPGKTWLNTASCRIGERLGIA